MRRLGILNLSSVNASFKQNLITDRDKKFDYFFKRKMLKLWLVLSSFLDFLLLYHLAFNEFLLLGEGFIKLKTNFNIIETFKRQVFHPSRNYFGLFSNIFQNSAPWSHFMPRQAENKWRNLLLSRHFFCNLYWNRLVLFKNWVRKPLRNGLSILYHSIRSAYRNTACNDVSLSFGENNISDAKFIFWAARHLRNKIFA